MTTPLIGLPCRHDTSHIYAGEAITVQSDAYLNALTSCGATPLLIPLNLAESQLHQLYDLADGILLTGGGDIDPKLYPHHQTEQNIALTNAPLSDVQPDRDQLELKLAQWAFADQKPLLGICRGIQILALWCQGQLCPDIPTQLPEAIHHQYSYLDDLAAFEQITHQVNLTPTSRLAQICHATTLQVNSLHHQAVLSINAPLQVVGCSDDGLIEAVEIPEHPFFSAVQWHPEHLLQHQTAARNLFQAFVQSCTSFSFK